jgi:hypothetical protein
MGGDGGGGEVRMLLEEGSFISILCFFLDYDIVMRAGESSYTHGVMDLHLHREGLGYITGHNREWLEYLHRVSLIVPWALLYFCRGSNSVLHFMSFTSEHWRHVIKILLHYTMTSLAQGKLRTHRLLRRTITYIPVSRHPLATYPLPPLDNLPLLHAHINQHRHFKQRKA